MWKRRLINICTPILFVLVSVVSNLFIADMSRHETKVHQAEIEHVTQVEVIIKEAPIPTVNLISPYDPIFMDVAVKHKLDWLLLAAIANAESRFQPDAKSHMGALGLMQVMPWVAKNMNYDPKQLLDPKVNVEVASNILQENKKMLGLPKHLDEEERLKFILACYNAGYSRIADAQNLAEYFGPDDLDWGNAHDWDIVALFLEWLSDPEFAEMEVVKSGAFYGSNETLSYVNKVLRIYNDYRNKIAK